MVRYVVENYPDVHVLVRAFDRRHVYELWAAGARDVIRENFDGAVRAARSALEALGVHPYEAEQQTRGFVESDKKMVRELAGLYDPDIPVHENAAYVAKTREMTALIEANMRGSSAVFGSRADRGWVPSKRSPPNARKKTTTVRSGLHFAFYGKVRKEPVFNVLQNAGRRLSRSDLPVINPDNLAAVVELQMPGIFPAEVGFEVISNRPVQGLAGNEQAHLRVDAQRSWIQVRAADKNPIVVDQQQLRVERQQFGIDRG